MFSTVVVAIACFVRTVTIDGTARVNAAVVAEVFRNWRRVAPEPRCFKPMTVSLSVCCCLTRRTNLYNCMPSIIPVYLHEVIFWRIFRVYPITGHYLCDLCTNNRRLVNLTPRRCE